MSVFGQIITGRDVEDACEATLALWLPTYLGEMERLTGRDPGDLPTIGYWQHTNVFPRADSVQPPAGWIVSPGTPDRPERNGKGEISAWFRIGVAVICSAATRDDSAELAKLYGAAIRTLLLQRPSLGGFATRLELVAELYDDVPENYLPIGASAQVECDVFVNSISSALAGPSQPAPPPAPPPGDWPEVQEAHVTVDLEAITS